MNHRPIAIGLLVCEQVIVEEGTGNVTPVNCFSRRRVPSFPADPFPFVVFAFLTDGAGQIPLEVLIHRLDTLEDIYRRADSFHLLSRLQSWRYILRIRHCSFPVAGQYQVTLLADNDVLAQHKISILQENPT
jgi:hypothetical protein